MRRARNDDEYEPEMPPAGDAEYLLGHLWDVGPAMAAGGYPGPVTYEEMRAWMDLTGVELEPWEVHFLRRLSGEYLSESHRAEKRDCAEPVMRGSSSRDLAAVAKTMQESLRALAKL